MASELSKGAASEISPAPASSNVEPSTEKKTPAVVLCIGMAGSGKTTLMQRLNAYLHQQGKPPYVVNLDPAVTHMPYQANIDIRDTVDYKEVMKQYNLGPNGGIMTALNLFTTKFDQVLQFIEKRAETVDHVLIDTPGQIEIFTWSASGSIITDAIASSLPTCVAYIIDTPRTTAPATFMSNMLYACSILYKTKLPFILVFNKIDVQGHGFALDWMSDFEVFQDALREREKEGREGEPGYMHGLMNSMSLVLDEFYKNLRAVGVSAMTGEGMEEFFTAVEEARKEYESDYRPELEKLAKQKEDKKKAFAQSQLDRLMADMAVSPSTSASNPNLSNPLSSNSARPARRAPGDDADGIIQRDRYREDDPWNNEFDDDNEDRITGGQEGEAMWGDSDEDVEIDRNEDMDPSEFLGGGGGKDALNWPRPG
ncbi:xpa-binding protein 1 [Phaffia rhodozyma]|uniref:GPN-loop GTPase n=1 Tax=Phaffia rhodozyma TaxID=264483 RepID=A0A0F7STF5_PHARH|nr:xpa-binding protein 1 [Phaffia rhodozyma]